jgi:hypothetical protein
LLGCAYGTAEAAPFLEILFSRKKWGSSVVKGNIPNPGVAFRATPAVPAGLFLVGIPDPGLAFWAIFSRAVQLANGSCLVWS